MECSNLFPLFGPFDWGSRPFWAEKIGFVGTKSAHFWEGTSRLAASAPGTTGEFLGENLDLARPPTREWDG